MSSPIHSEERAEDSCATNCSLLAVAFGGGTNSTAMLCGFIEGGIKPDLILFADTGGEMPQTYDHVAEMNIKVGEWWGMEIETVRQTYKGEFEGLENNCHRKMMLPSLAYGRKGCSQKYKVMPQTKRLFQFMDERGVKEVRKAIGYDANESHRQTQRVEMEHPKNRIERFWYPLIEWGWRREECVEVIARHGITQPGKSACFFCPAMKRGEILKLKRDNPELLERALAIEKNAVTRQNRGLGGEGRFWRDMVAADEAQGKLFDWIDTHDAQPVPCGCFDG